MFVCVISLGLGLTGSPLGAQTDDERSDTEDTEFALEPDEDPDEEDYWQIWDAQLEFSGRQFVEVDVEQTDFVNDPTRETVSIRSSVDYRF